MSASYIIWKKMEKMGILMLKKTMGGYDCALLKIGYPESQNFFSIIPECRIMDFKRIKWIKS